MRSIATLFAFGLLAFARPALAARLSLVGVANSSQPTQPGMVYAPATTFGGGALFELRMVPLIGLEFGALYAPRKAAYSTVTPAVANITVTGNGYQFPALLRLHLGRFFSLGVGGYYAKGKGDVTVETEMNGNKTTQQETYAQLQQSDSDYGIATSLALTTRLAPLTYFLLDGRYLIGLKNTSLAAGGERKFNDMQVLAGLQFGF